MELTKLSDWVVTLEQPVRRDELVDLSGLAREAAKLRLKWLRSNQRSGM